MSDNRHFSINRKPMLKLGSWMKKIPNRLISELTIPGTHDTCAKDAFNSILQTQIWHICDQLTAGIRFFDIRCRHINNSLHIYHDLFDCNISMKEVLDNIIIFLKQNPSETIIMRIKEEYIETNCSRSFKETFNLYYQNYFDMIYMTDYIPYLDEIRGKIWPILNFEFPFGYKWYDAHVQDNWQINSDDDLENKKDLIANHLKRAIICKEKNLFINFCSGTGYFWPDEIAYITNSIPFAYTGKFGIIVFDFPGEALITHIIYQNLIYLNKELLEYPLCIFNEKEDKQEKNFITVGEEI
jgi:1-phosphatidylinositol phosphodiesterase